MTANPIINAIELLDAALIAAFTPLVPTFQGVPAVFFMQAPSGVSGALASGSLTKAIIISFTDSGGKRKDRVGYSGWEGRTVVHCYSDTKATSNALLSSVSSSINTLSIQGYTVDCTWVRPTIYVPQHNIWRLSGVWDIWIQRA
jgi:hypothetical protein